VHRKDLDRLTGPDAVHQGAVMMARPLKQPHLDKIDRTGTVVLLDQVTDPHNVGAIMRSCAAFAVSALVATARHSPEGSAVVVKSASGAAEYVPFVKVTNLARAMEELREYGFTIVGLDSEAEARSKSYRCSNHWPLCLAQKARACANSRERPVIIWPASTCRVTSRASTYQTRPP
jgi:tRNA G18 (ribose-2'-O)-methylase SpoU